MVFWNFPCFFANWNVLNAVKISNLTSAKSKETEWHKVSEEKEISTLAVSQGDRK